MATKTEIAKIMALMSLAWPKYELQEGTISLYGSLLEHYDTKILELSAKHLMVTKTFFPALAEWIQAIVDIQMDKASIPSDFEAWEEAIQKIREIGQYRPVPKFSNPFIEKTVNHFGWVNLCLADNNDFTRQKFCNVYKTMIEQTENELKMLPEVKNAQKIHCELPMTMKREIAEKSGAKDRL